MFKLKVVVIVVKDKQTGSIIINWTLAYCDYFYRNKN